MLSMHHRYPFALSC